MATVQIVRPSSETRLARSLQVLEPLIREDIVAGEDAGTPFFIEAGEKLREAKTHFKSGFYEWATKKFRRSQTTIQDWMRSAANQRGEQVIEYQLDTDGKTAGSGQPSQPKTLSETIYPNRKADHTVAWVKAVRQETERLNVKRMAQDRQDRQTEKELCHKLGLKLIDIGYKVLAAKLHPDKPGGSEQAMQRLNQVRKILKGAI